MNRIPRELIKHLEWHQGQEVPVIEPPKTSSEPTINTEKFSIDDLINNGKLFYNDEENSDGLYVGVPIALREALKYTDNKGIVASLPYLITGKAKADKTNYLWKSGFSAQSEENVGIDKNGAFSQGKPVIVVVHGGGLWNSERIEKAYAKGLTEQSAGKLTEQEFNELLKGKLSDGRSIPIYAYDDFEKMKIEPTQNYAIVLDFKTVKNTKSDYHTKEEFMQNPLIIARAGGLENLETYFDKASLHHPEKNKVGNSHRFNEINPLQWQGRLLFLNNSCYGFYGDLNLSEFGRFVGIVAPSVDAPDVI